MNSFSNIPLVRLVLPLLMGIILYTHLEYNFNLMAIFAILAVFLALGLIIRYFILQHFGLRHVFGLNVMLLLVFAGYWLTQSRFQKNNPAHFSQVAAEDAMLRLRLTEPVSEKRNSYQLKGSITHMLTPDSAVTTKGNLIVWLEKDSLVQDLRYGDVIIIPANFQQVQPPLNPNAFNFKNFLSHQNIFHQAYFPSGQWYYTGENKGNPVIKYAHKMRQKALETLEENQLGGKEFAVASALLLGYRDFLDEDLQREFAGAGAMHILCVSGLHVGIIFLALNLIFGFLKKLPKGRFIKTIIIIVLIWFYAAITGFSPSVMRASTMFSFVAIGQSFSRTTNIYNTLAASALILVLLDPHIITRIGFQLSYVAVISIVWLQPLFYKQLYFKNPIMDHAWGIITVSLAAQLGTGPLALYYFNQFPNYFLLTNLVVIPLTGLIIKSGIFMFMVSPIAFLGKIVGQGLSFILLVLHSAVRFIEGLPFSVSNNIYLSFPETLLIFGLVILGGFAWLSARKSYVFALLAGILLLAANITARQIKNDNQLKLVVYHVPNGSAIDVFSGKNCYFMGCENTLTNAANLDYHVAANRLKMGAGLNSIAYIDNEINHVQEPEFMLRKPFIQLENISVMLVNQDYPLPDPSLLPSQLNYMILSGNSRLDLESVAPKLQETMIIIDSSSDFRQTNRWLNQCDSLDLSCWSVRQQGAFTIAVR